MPKLTFSLDEESVQTLRRVAERSRKPQSLIVREAIAQYAERDEVLPAEERERLLAVVHRIKQRPATRPPSDVREELREIRRSRRAGWSRPVR
jgi:metal-responsive CopG/Arc/MetJ family transcriptional regulator